jgi:hypothetical protein
MRDVTIAALATDVTEALLQPRRVHLKHRAPRTPELHMLRRRIAAERAKPMEMLLKISFADLTDGAPLAAVLRPYEAIIDLLKVHATEHHRFPHLPALLPLMQRETRAQAALDCAQQQLLELPASDGALAEVEDRAADYDRAKEALVDAVHVRRTHLRIRSVTPAA